MHARHYQDCIKKKIYLHLENANMARNEGTLVGLEKKKQFQFNYRKRINGVKLIRKGSKHQAIVRRNVKRENPTVQSKSPRKPHDKEERWGERGRENTIRFFVLSEQTLRSKSPRKPHANEERWEERGRENTMPFFVLSGWQNFAKFTRYYYFIIFQSEGSLLR